ncbi:MAG: sulfatase family protein, partial [Candidatus Heimdallarchaeota archaeon]
DDYPKEEFSSISVEQGFGGNFYQGDEDIPPNDVEMSDKPEAWCNSLCHGGNMRMIRKDDWKLIYDSLGRGELYDLPTDPAELKNQFDNPEHADKKNELLADLLKWTIRLTDPLPAPVKFELQNIHSRNYNR